MPEENLTKDDLVLLMESYRNMIVMHQTILDQSTKTIEKLDGITSKQDNISSKQVSICGNLTKITGRVDEIVGGCTTIVDKIDKHHEKSMETHNKLTNKIHLGWIGMGTIIIGLIGLIVTITSLVHDHLPTP